MSTRGNIAIKKADGNYKYIYHHHDSYPKFLGLALLDYLSKRYTNWDKENYFAPQEGEAWDGDAIFNDLCENGIHSTYEDGKPFHDTEYEEIDDITWDAEYVYIIDCSKHTLNCYNKVVEGEHEKKRNEYLLAHYGFSTKFNVNEPGDALIISAKLKK